MSTLDLPETHYARSGELNIAYQVMGDGPIDLIFVPGMITHVDFLHEIPGYTNYWVSPSLPWCSGVARTRWLDDGVVGRGCNGEGLLGEAMKEQPAGL
jgi:hypothetical protein